MYNIDTMIYIRLIINIFVPNLGGIRSKITSGTSTFVRVEFVPSVQNYELPNGPQQWEKRYKHIAHLTYGSIFLSV